VIGFPWFGRRSASRGAHERHQARRTAGVGAQEVIRGERGPTVASRARSLQSRLNGVLAVALAIGVGLTMLAWYYAEVLRRPGKSPVATPTQIAATRMRLPPLGPVLPRPPLAPQRAITTSHSTARLKEAISLLPAEPIVPRQSHTGVGSAVGSRRRRVLARRLSGSVFAGSGAAVSTPAAGSQARENTAGGPMGSANPGYQGPPVRATRGRESLRALLHPPVLRATRAQLLPNERLLLPKGAFIDCTLETAIDSTLPGMTTCVTATDTFSADGTVVLLGRGTKLIGETRGQVRLGMARVFVIWTEARTPSGVVMRLDSPGTDALGRSGLSGMVDRHFWQRFGAALLVSSIDAAVQSKLGSGSGTVVIDPTTSEDVMTDAVRSSADIPPTITVPNGARIQVLVARDVDFRSVYELVPRS